MSHRKAIARYEALLADDPANVTLLQKLGEVCQKAGEQRKAADAFGRLADCYAREGFFLKSIALLKQVLKLDPNRNDLRFKFAGLHLEIDLPAEAVAWLHQGLEHAHRERDVDGCLAASRKLVEVEPTRPGFRLYLADLLLWAGRMDDARGEILEAARLLRSAHPDLAARAEAMELGAGREALSSQLAALKALILELYERSTLERDLMALDFSAPNQAWRPMPATTTRPGVGFSGTLPFCMSARLRARAPRSGARSDMRFGRVPSAPPRRPAAQRGASGIVLRVGADSPRRIVLVVFATATATVGACTALLLGPATAWIEVKAFGDFGSALPAPAQFMVDAHWYLAAVAVLAGGAAAWVAPRRFGLAGCVAAVALDGALAVGWLWAMYLPFFSLAGAVR